MIGEGEGPAGVTHSEPSHLQPESVQVSVVLFWLQDLASEQRRQGKPGEAAGALRKALGYMSQDKGETLAQVGIGVEVNRLGGGG